MEILCLDRLEPAQATEWNAFVSAARHQHPRQDCRFAEVVRAEGHEPLFVLGRSGGNLTAAGLFSRRRHPFLPGAFTEASCLSGPVCDAPDAMAQFLDLAARHPAFARTGRIRVTPFWTDAEADGLHGVLAEHGWHVSEPEPFRHTGWVDLQRPAEDILAGFSKSARREERRAGRQGVEIRRITGPDEATVFLDSLDRLRLSRGLGAVNRAGFMTAFAALYGAAEVGSVWGAFHEGAFLSGLQLYRGRHAAHGRHFTTEPDRLQALGNLRIAPALWLRGMLWAREQGCAVLDVEEWRPDIGAGDKKHNIYKYKGEFGPRPVRRIGERGRQVAPLLALSGDPRGAARRLLAGLGLRGPHR